MDLDLLTRPDVYLSLLTLTAMEVVLGKAFSGRDLILLGGGLFLIAKATHEIHDKLEVAHERPPPTPGAGAFLLILVQILALDLVFSLDSVITALGWRRRSR